MMERQLIRIFFSGSLVEFKVFNLIYNVVIYFK